MRKIREKAQHPVGFEPTISLSRGMCFTTVPQLLHLEIKNDTLNSDCGLVKSFRCFDEPSKVNVFAFYAAGLGSIPATSYISIV